jgi:energy-coupling factor transporter ATP-binding protein EcfA2
MSKEKKKVNQVGKDSVGKSQDNNSGLEDNDTKNTSDLLIGFVSDSCELFHNKNKECFAKINIDGRTEVWDISSTGFADWIRGEYFRTTSRGIPDKKLNEITPTLKALAIHKGYEEEVFMRVAQVDGKIYIDLCDKDWNVVEITKDKWRVIDKSPVSFIRNSYMLPMQEPRGSYTVPFNQDIQLLKKHINIRSEDFILVVGILMMYLQYGDGDMPLLIVNGEAGTGKSTFTKMIRELVDPNSEPLLMHPKEDVVPIIANSNYVVSLDNLSGIRKSFSDLLCTIATGTSHITRRHYTNKEMSVISMKRPVILNGIEDIASRDDLVRRSVILELLRIEDGSVSDDAEVMNNFRKDVPVIFGALCTGLMMALKNIDTVQINNITSMSRFCRWSGAAMPAFNWTADMFMEGYHDNLKRSYIAVLDTSPFTAAIMKMFEDKSDIDWNGTPDEFREYLEMVMRDNPIIRSKYWVKSAKGVMNIIRRSRKALEKVGITIETYKSGGNKTRVRIYKPSELHPFDE